MGILKTSDIADMLTGAIEYLRGVKEHRIPYVKELVIMAVAQHLYCMYCRAIPNDTEHVKATVKTVCEAAPFQYKSSCAYIIKTRNLVAHYLGTDACREALEEVDEHLQLVLEWLV